MFDLRQIQYFEAVYRLRSFSQAADEMHLTHAALTKSIKTLEHKWDVQLFHRTTRRVSPTAAGHRLYEKVPLFLAEAEALRQTAMREQHHIRLMCGPVVLDTLVHPALLALREKYPDSRVSAETKPPLEALEDIVERRADLMLIHANTLKALPYGDRLEVTPVVDEAYAVVCRRGHEVLSGTRQLADIIPHDWAIAGFDMFFEQTLPDDLGADLQAHDFPKYRLLSQTACLDMVRQSDVLTLVPQRSAAQLDGHGDVESFAFPGPLRFSVCAARLKTRGDKNQESEMLDAFISALNKN
ncbi:MAG: LysR family transcriptional regulator [Alphaproteobacteria bacterium]|nr:LysR family transcriptional regulator [Alphaproteobacteria bacterium]